MINILVIVDAQNDFLTGCLGNKECEAVIPEIVSLIKNNYYNDIYVTLDTHTENYLHTQEGKRLPVEHCIKGSYGWELNSEIKKALVEEYEDNVLHFIEKPVFGSLSLGNELKSKYENNEDITITFCGVCTGICVISNVIIAKAALPEAKIQIIEKACACVTPDTNKTAIEAMKLCHVDII